jgi:hypothetical protein
LLVEAIVLVLHVWLDMLLCVLLERCSLVQEAGVFLVLHGNLWVTTAIDDSDSIPISLRTVRHKAFEVGLFQTIFSHECHVMTLQFAAMYT